MAPALKPGDKIDVVTNFTVPALMRGKIIVFKKPPGDNAVGIVDLVKRIIGLPGETIFATGGSVYIDSRRLNEPWLPGGDTTTDFPSAVVPYGDYFVMGDNRGDSADSRVFGPIPANLVIAVSAEITYPPNRVGPLSP